MLARNAAYCGEHRATHFGEVQIVTAAVTGIATAFDEAAGFEFVDEGHQAAGNHSEPRGERLLRNCRAGGKDTENAGMRRSKLQLGEPPGKSRSGMSTHLG